MKNISVAVAIIFSAIALSSCETMTMATPWGPEIRTSWVGGIQYYSNLIVFRNDTNYTASLTVGYNQKDVTPHSTFSFDIYSGWGNYYNTRNISILLTIFLPNGRTVSFTPSVYLDSWSRQIRTLVIEEKNNGIYWHW